MKRHVQSFPNLGANIWLASVYAELGREREARAVAAAIMRVNPDFSLEVLEQRSAVRDPALERRRLANLRKAGLK